MTSFQLQKFVSSDLPPHVNAARLMIENLITMLKQGTLIQNSTTKCIKDIKTKYFLEV